jgi:hypothetical protein
LIEGNELARAADYLRRHIDRARREKVRLAAVPRRLAAPTKRAA